MRDNKALDIHEDALKSLKKIAESLSRKKWLELTSDIEKIRKYIDHNKAQSNLYQR